MREDILYKYVNPVYISLFVYQNDRYHVKSSFSPFFFFRNRICLCKWSEFGSDRADVKIVYSKSLINLCTRLISLQISGRQY